MIGLGGCGGQGEGRLEDDTRLHFLSSRVSDDGLLCSDGKYKRHSRLFRENTGCLMDS